MSFSPEQLRDLTAPLSRSVVKTRQQSGRSLSYVEGWHVIAEANRIFGFDGWSSETLEIHCVAERERLIGQGQQPGFGVSYTARVRITIHNNENQPQIYRDGVGAGHGIDLDIGRAHESAIKEAETDGRKRALMTFGNQFGLALYDKEQANVADDETAARDKFLEECKATILRLSRKPELLTWWNSDEQKRARRDFEINTDDLAALKALVTSNLPLKQGGAT